ncbi:MAG: hypothetical protein CSA81_07000 [Acidobacteria bacterium]|nr:MAG: hypothetical protein CSA81_07000 [Acidobacteriota bacterium]
MIINNNTPYQAESTLDKDGDLNSMIVVVIKATFQFNAQGQVNLAAKQIPVYLCDEMIDSYPIGSVRFESDMAPFKPKGDLLILGHACPPGGSATSIEVGFRCRDMEKVLAVFGDRKWEAGGFMGGIQASQPEPFEELELTFGRSFGGIDMVHGAICAANQAGMGMISKKAKKEEIIEKPLPNIENPNHLIRSWKDHPTPVGMGHVSKGSSERVVFLGTYDEAWHKDRKPDRPIDFDFQFFNSAPKDQQLDGFFQGGELIELLNLTPGTAQVQFTLPEIKVNATLKRRDVEQKEPFPLNLDTVCVMTKDMTFTLTWRGWLPVYDPLMQDVEMITIESSQ